MGGFFGGRSDAEKQGQSKVDSIFNYGLPAGQEAETESKSLLASPAAYFERLLKAGRTDTAAQAAPAINSALSQKDAMLRKQASSGTARTGGTAEGNREAGVDTNSLIDNLIQQAMMGGKSEGAAGATNLGQLGIQNALALLGFGNSAGLGSLQAGSAASDRRASFGQMVTKALLGGK